MKYKILKVIDVSGLTFLTPVVRLCYGEEPQKQWREIARFIGAPLVAFVVFLGLWTVLAPKHRTKSGEVPTPAVVLESANDIWKFHLRENAKEHAYSMTGEERQAQLAEAQERLAKLPPYEAAAAKKVAEANEARAAAVTAALEPLQQQYDERQAEIAAAQAARESDLLKQAAGLESASVDEKQAYLAAVASHLAAVDDERDELQELKGQQTEVRSQPFAPLAAALRTQTKIAEEKQFLTKLIEQLDRANRAQKATRQVASLRDQQKQFLASSGEDAYALAKSIDKSKRRIETTAESTYAKPYTLPMQIWRSVLCVFVGFLIGTAIAVPIGVCCGLSKTAMAALTPFIALFKPVSPIVWLPLALIIVGGFIPDPDKNPLIQWMENLPFIGWMQINPAFIASAITVALCSLWATMTNTALGVASIDKDHLNVARVLQLGFWERLFKIIIPSALPLIFAGLRISLGVGWMVLIAAELLSSSEGIGKFVWDQFNNGASDSFAKMMVVVFVVGAIGLLLDRIMIVLQRMVSFEGSVAAI
ncbi:MAG: ABC transporter permease [Planctomycetaceae bacterium]|nr:ABC transporter permease [Planctomycetaceae bacterium]